jgi:hypothetical protein
MASMILIPRPDPNPEPEPKGYRVLVKVGWTFFWIDAVMMVGLLVKAIFFS